MQGEFPLLKPYYISEALPGNQTVQWSNDQVDSMLERLRQGEEIGAYHSCGADLLKLVPHFPLGGRSVVVFGSQTPWVEAIALNCNASSVTTFDYNRPICEDTRINTASMSELARHRERYDVAISYSSLEHDGLGRYGDPLDPDGDFAAVAEVLHVLKPDGLVFFGVPISATGGLEFNAHRVYNQHRFALLIQPLDYLGVVPFTADGSGALELGSGNDDWRHAAGVWETRPAGEASSDNQPWFVLRKPRAEP